MEFLSPQLFDALIVMVIIVGGALAIRRIRSDFKRGSRFPEDEKQEEKA